MALNVVFSNIQAAFVLDAKKKIREECSSGKKSKIRNYQTHDHSEILFLIETKFALESNSNFYLPLSVNPSLSGWGVGFSPLGKVGYFLRP